jgi:hypothetical protein
MVIGQLIDEHLWAEKKPKSLEINWMPTPFWRWEKLSSKERKWLVQRHPQLVSSKARTGTWGSAAAASCHVAHGWNLLLKKKNRCSIFFKSFLHPSKVELFSSSRGSGPLPSPLLSCELNLFVWSLSLVTIVQHRAKNNSLMFFPHSKLSLKCWQFKTNYTNKSCFDS